MKLLHVGLGIVSLSMYYVPSSDEDCDCTQINCVPVTESHLSISKYCVHISFTIQSLVLSVIVYPVMNVYMYSLLQNTLYINHIV